MSTELEAAELLEKGAEILEIGGWCKYMLWDGTRHCAVGALLEASGITEFSANTWTDYRAWEQKPSSQTALKKLASVAVNTESEWKDYWAQIAMWNNCVANNAAEVIDTMKQAAKDLRNEAVSA